MDSDGSGVSAKAAGHLSGLQSYRATVQTDASPGESPYHGRAEDYE